MQSALWYWNRLKSMQPAEMAWRAVRMVSGVIDRARVPLGWHPRLTTGDWPEWRLTDVHPCSRQRTTDAVWRVALAQRADDIAAHSITLFGVGRSVGTPIDWHRDHEHGAPSPRGWADSIDYRRFETTGDAKLVWELNRHHHLVVLARAWRAGGDIRHAREVVAQLRHWIAANPFGYGMNWRSPLELAIRLINWAWALDLMREAGVADPETLATVRAAACLHVWEIARKYSRGSSANNHVIGEAAGVFVGASYFLAGRDRLAYAPDAWQLLEREAVRQTFPDGANREQALGYHLFVIQFLALAAWVARRQGIEPNPRFMATLFGMFDYVEALAEGGRPPFYGDADDGYVLDLAGGPPDAMAVLALGPPLGWQPRSARPDARWLETNWWLVGGTPPEVSESSGRRAREPLRARAFPDSGLYLLQAGEAGSGGEVSVTLDAGELGFGAIAAHGHADALGITVRVGCQDVLIDPGTYDYFSHPDFRRYFRSTRSHNTLSLDGLDQSEMLGPFLWGRRAVARCLEWVPSATGGHVVAEHDGYTALERAAVHRRRVELRWDAREISIEDVIQSTGDHEVEFCLHFAPEWRVVGDERNRFRLSNGKRTVMATIAAGLRVSAVEGSRSPILGWCSQGYHRLEPCVTLVGVGRVAPRIPLLSSVCW